MSDGWLRACLFFGLLSAVIAGVAWIISPRPDAFDWTVILSAGMVAVVLLSSFSVGLWWPRTDLAPDFLFERTGSYFERDGFCFSVVPTVEDELVLLRVYFQNRFERPCNAAFALRQAASRMGRNKDNLLELSLTCEGGAFGVITAPAAVPAKYQGKRVKINVAARCHYPNGKGKQLRFKTAAKVDNDLSFGGGWGTNVSTGAMVLGSISVSDPAHVSFQMPVGVRETLPPGLEPSAEEFWQLGDDRVPLAA